MNADAELVMGSMFAVVGGLLLFALVPLLGVAVVRWLRLPQDPPDALRLDPPPPGVRPPGAPEAARAIAAGQARLAALYHRTYAILRLAQSCGDALAGVELQLAAVPPPATAAAVDRLRAAAVTASAASAAAQEVLRPIDLALRPDGIPRQPGTVAVAVPASAATAPALAEDALAAAARSLADHEVAAQGAYAAAEAALVELPDLHGRRRLYLLLGVALFMALWFVAMSILMRR